MFYEKFNEMTRGITETAAKNVEKTRKMLRGKIEKTDENSVRMAGNYVTCAMSNINQIQNSMNTLFASNMNAISNMWNEQVREREEIRAMALDGIDSIFSPVPKPAAETVTETPKAAKAGRSSTTDESTRGQEGKGAGK